MPNYKHMHNKPQAEHLFHEHNGSCQAAKHSEMKASMLFECRPLPPYPPPVHLTIIHVISVPRPSPFFATLLLKVNQRGRPESKASVYEGM